MRFILATANQHKLSEFRAILAPYAVEPMPADIEPPPEGAESFRANAGAKAHALAQILREREALAPDTHVIADDSGLEVEALGGAPGVISSRYAGVHGDDAANNAKLLADLAEETEPEARRARFVSVIACVSADGEEFDVRGEWPGVVATAPRGFGGFGYDPVIVPDGETRTVAELSDEEKSAASHRARAGRALLAALTGVP